MNEPTSSRYDLHLSLSGLPSGGAEEVQECIQAALAAVSEGMVTLTSVTECAPETTGIEEHITPLHVLVCTLPTYFRCSGTIAAIAEHYHRELSCLWRSARDNRCVRAVIELRPWRQAGTQWICEFASYDRGAPHGNQFNFHGQNTSQWQNQETGWAGHQGALVLDTADGQISSHH